MRSTLPHDDIISQPSRCLCIDFEFRLGTSYLQNPLSFSRICFARVNWEAAMKLFHFSVLFLSLGAAAWCQSGNGAITGQVRDTSGATVADAKVTLKDRGTAVTRGFITEAVGAYRFPG